MIYLKWVIWINPRCDNSEWRLELRDLGREETMMARNTDRHDDRYRSRVIRRQRSLYWLWLSDGVVDHNTRKARGLHVHSVANPRESSNSN